MLILILMLNINILCIQVYIYIYKPFCDRSYRLLEYYRGVQLVTRQTSERSFAQVQFAVGDLLYHLGGFKVVGNLRKSGLNAKQLDYHRVYTGTIGMSRQIRVLSSYEHYVLIKRFICDNLRVYRQSTRLTKWLT